MAQFLRPNSTNVQGNWSGSHTDVDDVSSDYGATAISVSSTGTAMELGLSSPGSTPNSGTCTLRCDAARLRTNKNATVVVRVIDATNGTIATATHANPGDDGTTPWDVQAPTFNTSQVTDWDTLVVEAECTVNAGITAYISWIEVETPDGAAVYPEDADDEVWPGDEATARQDHVTAVADIVEPGDEATAALTQPVASADTVELTDASVIEVKKTGAGLDGAKLSDVATGVTTLSTAAADIAELSDTATIQIIMPLSATDTVELSDTDTGRFDFKVAAEDGVEVTDTSTFHLVTGGTTWPKSAADTVEVSDASSIQLTLPLTTPDGTKQSDEATAEVKKIVAAADTIDLSDAAAARMVHALYALDGMEGGDSSGVRSDFKVDALDGTDLGDAATQYDPFPPGGPTSRCRIIVTVP